MTITQYSEGLQHQLDLIMQACPLVPVIRIEKLDQAIPMAEALIAGGIKVLEITLRTPVALQVIRQLREAFPDVWVGAGTVANVEQFCSAESYGAQFIITPGLTGDLLAHGLKARTPLLPGASTLSEMMEGMRLGYRSFKFFPAEVAGGIAALKAFGGPFPDLRFVPTGGITAEMARDYLQLANVEAVGGSWLTPQSSMDNEDWQAMTRIAQQSLDSL